MSVHLIGSRNGLRPFPGRTAADDAAATRRTEAAATWLREGFGAAATSNASAVVALHGNPFDEEPKDREPFQPFLTTLQQEALQFGRPVLVAHGDDHGFLVDRPLPLANLTRLEVPGSPDVGWVRVTVTPSAGGPFVFEPRVIQPSRLW